MDYSSGKGKQVARPRTVCARGVAVPNTTDPMVGLRMRDRCRDAKGDSRRQLDHIRTHCHGEEGRFHTEHAVQLAEAVLASYEPKNRGASRSTVPGLPTGQPIGTLRDAYDFTGVDRDDFERQLAIARTEKAGAR